MNGQNPLHLDAGQQIFFTRELEHIQAETFDIEHPELKARSLFPVSFEIPTGAKTFTYRQYDHVGVAKVIHSYANDLPRVDIKGKEFTGNIEALGDSYGYNIQDIRAAQMAGLPLERMRADAAKRALMELENDIAFNGLADNNLGGFLSNPNVPNGVVVADGVGASTLWSDKNADQIIRDFQEAFTEISDVTKNKEVPNTALFPIRQWGILRAPRSIGTETSILNWLKNNYPEITLWDSINELTGTGTGDTNQFVLYNRDPRKLRMMVPQDFEQFPAQLRGLDYEVPCHMRSGGVVFYYPLSAIKRYGI